MTPKNLRDAAKQGDASAIASLLNKSLQSQGIATKASLKDKYLQVMLEASAVPEQATLVQRIRKGLTRLESEAIERVKVYGKQAGEDFPAWEEEFELAVESESSETNAIAETETREESSWFGSIFGTVGDIASKAGETVTGVALGTGEAIGNAAAQAGKAVTGTASAIGNAAMQTGEVVTHAGGAVVGAVGDAAGKATEGAGYIFDIVRDNPALKQLTKAFKLDWLVAILDEVDLVKAEAGVRKLQEQHPDESPREIAHRLMLQKALLAGGSGLATSLLPGAATALLAVDMASTTLLQAEMVYQIAGIYGLDLQDFARKGEVLAIFGLSFGGSQAIDAGLSLFGNIPVAGAVIGASTNAAMIYALGYGACRFYEAKLNPETALAEELETATEESEKYIEDAIAQEVIMDRILVHVILAGNPGKTWEEILPELQALSLSPASLETISSNLDSPPELETLLDEINSDFAVPLLVQCEKIAQLDGVITPEEAKVIETIKQKDFGIPKSIKTEFTG
ncbi:hypothetical protein IQ249_22220 [Lusitaniella coriacea LEGE 07157]|uniref:EcsC family protein n=1 Tax=Lusitaniella coriacea LEGE 07157 TaxID=945747 RepID=A0A8J7J6C5_9CYAN|nr:hypothetical protein [Lusitaniella coriacea]MBE9118609.1 hypothetical protein [Lusitaniella coriacea LEGE 07157]